MIKKKLIKYIKVKLKIAQKSIKYKLQLHKKKQKKNQKMLKIIRVCVCQNLSWSTYYVIISSSPILWCVHSQSLSLSLMSHALLGFDLKSVLHQISPFLTHSAFLATISYHNLKFVTEMIKMQP